MACNLSQYCAGYFAGAKRFYWDICRGKKVWFAKYRDDCPGKKQHFLDG